MVDSKTIKAITIKAIELNPTARQWWVTSSSHQLGGGIKGVPAYRDANGMLQVVREKLIMENVDTTPFLWELAAVDDEHWASHPRNKLKIQRNTENISLRDSLPPPPGMSHVREVQGAVNSSDAGKFPMLMSFLRDFALGPGGGTLARAMIVRLKPLEQVYLHYDLGLYYMLRDRYHLVLKSTGSRMVIDGVESVWHEGELWWFNNKLDHEAYNDSNEYRTHVIFDVLPDSMRGWAKICEDYK